MVLYEQFFIFQGYLSAMMRFLPLYRRLFRDFAPWIVGGLMLFSFFAAAVAWSLHRVSDRNQRELLLRNQVLQLKSNLKQYRTMVTSLFQLLEQLDPNDLSADSLEWLGSSRFKPVIENEFGCLGCLVRDSITAPVLSYSLAPQHLEMLAAVAADTALWNDIADSDLSVFRLHYSDQKPVGVMLVYPAHSSHGGYCLWVFSRKWEQLIPSACQADTYRLTFTVINQAEIGSIVRDKVSPFGVEIGKQIVYLSLKRTDSKGLSWLLLAILLLGIGFSTLLLAAFWSLVKKRTRLLGELVRNRCCTNPESPVSARDELTLVYHTVEALNVRISHLKQQLAERDESLSQFHLATVDGIVIHKNGIPVLVNPAMEKLSGFSADELRHIKPFDLIRVDEDTLLNAREKDFAVFEAELRPKAGGALFVEVQMGHLNFRGAPAESLVIRDITHRKSMEKELQRERMRQVRSVIDGQEKERQRLSRELHDGLGQNLVAIKLKLEAIQQACPMNLLPTMLQVKEMFTHTIEEVRRISNNLLPASLKEFSLAVVLRNLCTEIESNSGITVNLSVGLLPESLDQLLKTYIYRIVQEALTNIVKHSGATRAGIAIFSDFNSLHLQIEDNGVGFDSSQSSFTGNGLYNMKERVVLLNGTINFISSKGKGVKIVARLPLNLSGINNGNE